MGRRSTKQQNKAAAAAAVTAPIMQLGNYEDESSGGSTNLARHQLSIRSFFIRADPPTGSMKKKTMKHGDGAGGGNRKRSLSSVYNNNNNSSSDNNPNSTTITTTTTTTPSTAVSMSLVSQSSSASSQDKESSPESRQEDISSQATGTTTTTATAPRDKVEEEDTRRCSIATGNEPQHKKQQHQQPQGKEKKNKKFEQLYLDFGQRDFAKQIVCSICGMMYVHGVEEDIKQHLKVCKDFTHGVPFQLATTTSSSTSATATTTTSSSSSTGNSSHNNNNNNNVRIVAQFKDGAKICEVRSTECYKLRKKVAEVRVIVDKELGFVRSREPEDYLTTYLYINKKRVLGLVSAELINEAYQLETNYNRSRTGRKAVVGIHQIWVHSKFRGMNVATKLIDTIREKMVFNFVVPCHQIAFSSPTEAGVAFAKKYIAKSSSSDQVLVYDCH